MASEAVTVPHDVMLDTETMALTPDALVLSIGAVRFIPRSPKLSREDTLLVVPNFMEQVMLGRRVDPETQKWWGLPANERASEHWLTPAAGTQLAVRSALAELAQYVRLSQAERIWANGAVFDIGILEHMYRSVGMTIPWKYNMIRDSRTIRQEIRPIDDRELCGDSTAGEVPHHPVTDCRHQINDLWVRGF